MCELLYEMTLLMSPLLVFTADEVWGYLPQSIRKEESVHMARFPETNLSFQDPELMEKWEKLIEIRGEVSKCIEKARAKKEIGHPLDAQVTLSVKDEDLYKFLSSYQETLKAILIVSSVKISQRKEGSFPEFIANSEIPGLGINIGKAPGEKCERCWQFSPTVGEDKTHPSLCSKCRLAIT